jgi:hypothetical protein
MFFSKKELQYLQPGGVRERAEARGNNFQSLS